MQKGSDARSNGVDEMPNFIVIKIFTKPQDKIYGRVLYWNWMAEQGCVKYMGTWVKVTSPQL
jgi:hypothetical protein